jgi:hypothetical protein
MTTIHNAGRVEFVKALIMPTFAAAVMVLAAGDAEAGLVLTAEAPKVQFTTVTGVTTETFDELAPGRYSPTDSSPLRTTVGTLFSPGLQIVSADAYGGANGTNYLAIGAQSGQTTATLTFAAPQAFFGFWWSAADPLNSVEFYSGSTLLGSFDSAAALQDITASAYYGNPNYGQDHGEKFAYLDIFGTLGTTITSAVFNNIDQSTGFEVDNFSIRATPVLPTFPGTPLNGGIEAVAVSEPSSVIMLAVATLFGGGFATRRMYRNKRVAFVG